jgi:hypothetical protein
MIDGQKLALWTFAGFSTRFLKTVPYSDLPLSNKPDNIPMIVAGIKIFL